MKKSENVYKKLGLFLLLVLAVMLISRCVKDPAYDSKYTINATSVGIIGGTISPSGKIEVVSGSNKSFSLTPDAGFKADSISVNGKLLPLINNIYNIENITSDYKVEAIFKKTLSWYLMNGSWTKDSLIAREDDGIWSHYATSIPSVVTFLPNGRFTIYLDGVLIGDGSWFINEATNPPTLNWGEIVEIEKLNETSLILAKYDVQCIGCLDPNHISAIRTILSHH